MGKNRSASGLVNVIQYDDNGNISFVSGSTTLMSVSSSGAITTTGVISGSSVQSASLAQNSNLLQGTGSVGFTTTASFTATSGSASSRLTQIENVYATTGSNSFRATQSITGSLTVTGQIIAQTINVQQVTSSIVYSSGSNVFGCDINSRQTFTGSFYQTGSVAVFNTSVGIGSSCNPIYALDVYNRTGNVAMRLFQPSALSSDYNSMYFTGNHTCVTGYIGSAGSTTPNTSLQNSFYMGVQNAYPLKFATSDTTRVTIAADGITCFSCQVCSPQLYVGGALVSAGDTAAITLKQTSTTANTGIYLERSAEQKGYYIYMGGSLDSLNFQRNNAGTKVDVMSLTRDGNVGIGCTTPNRALTVNGCIGMPTSYNWGVTNDNDANWGFKVCSAGGNYSTFVSYASDAGSDRRGGIYNSNGHWVAYGNNLGHFVVQCNLYTSGVTCITKIGYNGYNGATGYDLLGHFDAGSTNIATLSGENSYTRVVAHIEWVSNYALAGTNMTMGYTIVDTRRGNSNTIWVNCACTILAYGDSPANPTFGWSNGVLSVSVPGSTGLTARFRISSYAATVTPNI